MILSVAVVVEWDRLRAEWFRHAPERFPITARPRGKKVTVLYTVVGDGIVVPTKCVWTNKEGFTESYAVPDQVGLVVLTMAEIADVRDRWYERRAAMIDLERLLGAAGTDGAEHIGGL